MTKDVTNIYNLALSLCQHKSRVSAPTEASREAEICTLWYSITRDVVLRAAYWPSTGVYRRLALLAEWDGTTDWDQDDPSPDWTFAYSIPSDMLRPRYLTTYNRFRMDFYRPTSGSPVRAIMTDLEDAILHYTFKQTTPAEWDDTLYMTVAYGLAGNIALPLTGKTTLADRNFQLANNNIRDAQAAVANSEEVQVDTMPEWIQARGYGDSGNLIRYYYPFGPAFSGSAQVATVSAVKGV